MRSYDFDIGCMVYYRRPMIYVSVIDTSDSMELYATTELIARSDYMYIWDLWLASISLID